MWIMLNDAFFSIVNKDCPPGHLLVRARRPGDIERVFGRRVKVTVLDFADYLYRAVVPKAELAEVLERELGRVDYSNFKDSVQDKPLHDAYMRVWTAMAGTQPTAPYSGLRQRAALPVPVQSKKKGGKNAKA
jgi:hypothetical protein